MNAAHGTLVPQNSIVSVSAMHETAADASAATSADAVATSDVEAAVMDASLVAATDGKSATIKVSLE